MIHKCLIFCLYIALAAHLPWFSPIHRAEADDGCDPYAGAGVLEGPEENIEEQIEEQLEEEIEEQIEEQIEEEIEEQVEEQIEEQIEEELEEQVEEQIEEQMEGEVEEELEEQVEDELEESAEEELEEELDERLEEELEEDPDENETDEASDGDGDDPDELEDELEDEQRFPEINLDDRGFKRVSRTWLVLTDKHSVASLRQLNFSVSRVTDIDSLNKVLVEVSEPTERRLSQVRNLIHTVLPKSSTVVDHNHLYSYRPETSAENAATGNAGNASRSHPRQPHNLMSLPAVEAGAIKIGLLDSQVDHQHESLQGATIRSKQFANVPGATPLEHGTAVASILVGQSAAYKGLLPDADLYAASVFYRQPKAGESALVTSLASALDWMAKMEVDVINMSLSGPDNAILRAMLDKLYRQGVILVASVGNNGPVGKPLFPAAYEQVVAVTAVTDKNLTYHMANRGQHVDLAAPGVQIQHAAARQGYRHSTGTSFAAPFVSASLAWKLAVKQKPGNLLVEKLFETAKDLGEPGHDDVYGYGLIQPFVD